MVKGVDSIIVPAGDYNIDFLSKLPQDIPQNFNGYYKEVLNYFKKAKDVFPLLHLVILPTLVNKTAFVQGLLLSKTMIEQCRLEENQFEEYGLPIFVDIPLNFKKRGVTVFDCCNRIVWDKIPIEYRHRRIIESNKYCICTHHYDFITPENCFLGVLQSAYNLFVEYQRYDETGEFNLNCLPHNYTHRR